MYQTPIYFAGCDLAKDGHIRLAAYLREMQKAACLDLNNFNLTPESLYARGIRDLAQSLFRERKEPDAKLNHHTKKTFAPPKSEMQRPFYVQLFIVHLADFS